MSDKAPIVERDNVAFSAPLGLTNSGMVLKIVDGIAAVAVEVCILNIPVGELTKLVPVPPQAPVAPIAPPPGQGSPLEAAPVNPSAN